MPNAEDNNDDGDNDTATLLNDSYNNDDKRP